MQVFTPYPNPIECANALFKDQKRFNKQIIECQQILSAINGQLAWRNHPCTLMYKPYAPWLTLYKCILEAVREWAKGKLGSEEDAEKILLHLAELADKIRPPFLTEEFCNQHKRRLFTKAPDLYPQFAEYGTSEINWYYVDGKLLKYKDGKQIKD